MYLFLLPFLFVGLYVTLFYFNNRKHKWWKGLILQVPFITNKMRFRILQLSGNPLVEKMAFTPAEMLDQFAIMDYMCGMPTIKKGLRALNMKHYSEYYWKIDTVVTQDSPYTNPLQRPYMFLPGLTSRKFWDTSLFPWAKVLEDNYQTIKKEMLENLKHFQPYRIIENNKYLKLGGGHTDTKDKVKPGWMMLYLCHNGPVAENMKRCPVTSRLLTDIPYFRCAMACFSSLTKRSSLGKHFGPSNAVLRCHLAVYVPEPDKISITVAGETRRWEEGKVMIFDDSYEHSVTHESDYTRVVLFFDVWNPDWTPEEVEVLNKKERQFQTHFSQVPGSFIHRMQVAFNEDKNVELDDTWFLPPPSAQ